MAGDKTEIRSNSPYMPDVGLFDRWFSERCELSSGIVSCADAYADWVNFIDIHGNNPGSKKLFGQMIRSKSVTTKQTRLYGKVTRVYNGMSLKPSQVAHA